MPLLKSYKTYKDGTHTEEVFYNPTTNYSYKPESGVVSHLIKIHKYEITGTMPPSLITDVKGKRYIVPQWIEVHPQTQLSDISFKKPVKRPRADIQVKTGNYKTTYNTTTKMYKCTCMGYFRAKDRRCKHIKALEEKLASQD